MNGKISLERLAPVLIPAICVVLMMAPDEANPLGASAHRLVKHSTIVAIRNGDGSLKRGVRNETMSENWSGYAIASYETSTPGHTQHYTAVQGSWMVPTASYAAGKSSSSQEYSSTWIGIGGNCENASCTTADNLLVQLGTEQDASSSGSKDYYAWYELLPDQPVLISHPIHPGDQIQAKAVCTVACRQGVTQTWSLSMKNETQGWSWSTTVQYQGSLLSAEWIEEAPWVNGVLPLADFGTATFDPASLKTNVSPDLSMGDAIVMEDPWGETSNPSQPVTGDAFSVCWGSGTSLTPCSPP